MTNDKPHRRPGFDDEAAVEDAERILQDALDDLQRRAKPGQSADLSWRTNQTEL
jgi:hypothetical protein